MSTSTGSDEAVARGAALTSSDPTWIGRYRLVRRLGAGGMGLVYLAETADRDLVAVKVIRPEYADDPVYRERFRREAQAASRVRSPAVAHVLEYDVAAAAPFLVTEYVPGDPLRDRVVAAGPLWGAELDAFAVGVARGLADIHAAGVVHRDVKPANIILSPLGPRIVDFGIASAAESTTRFTTTGEIVGSVGWMAPELLRQHPPTPASDVFAWGATVAFAATGRRPFGEGPDIGVAHRVLAGPPPDLAGVPQRWLSLVVAALAPDPAARPTAVELAGGPDGTRPAPALDPTRVAPVAQAEPVAPAPPVAAPAVRPRRRRRALGAVAGVVGAVAVLGALSSHRPPQPGATPAPTPAPSVRASARPATTHPATAHPATPRPGTSPAPAREPGRLVAARVPAAQDGDVVFALRDVRCGLRQVGRGMLAQDEAPGTQACTAKVLARNVGTRPHLLLTQRLVGPDGTGYDSNGFLPGRYGRPGLELRTLRPGQAVDAMLVWELPARVQPVAVQLRGDVLSPGTRRSLR